VPCDEGSRFTVYQRVFADIGDEQSIEQSLSTFSSHMRNIIGILAKAQPGTLVLLDELGAGTDPTEGSALARAVLETLLERGCAFVATTHHGELKVFAHNDPRLRNASVEFDLESLSPTYKLTIGLPGQSNALAIAGRLGLEATSNSKRCWTRSAGSASLPAMPGAVRRWHERKARICDWRWQSGATALSRNVLKSFPRHSARQRTPSPASTGKSSASARSS
jgi:DNA mismatch repair protein MutS2